MFVVNLQQYFQQANYFGKGTGSFLSHTDKPHIKNVNSQVTSVKASQIFEYNCQIPQPFILQTSLRGLIDLIVFHYRIVSAIFQANNGGNYQL